MLYGLFLTAVFGTLTLLLLNINRIVNYIAQILVDASKLDIEQITITSCTDSTFLLSMTARIHNTGPLPATISHMVLAMHATATGPALARISLPVIHAVPSGTTCTVSSQLIEILDPAALRTFSANLLQQAELPAYLRGTGTLTPLDIEKSSTQVRYEKVALLRGFDGLQQIDVGETRKVAPRALLKGKQPTAIEVDCVIASASPVEVDLGVVVVEIVYKGMRIATMEGEMFLKKGDNSVMLTGTVDLGSIGMNLGTGIKFLKKDILDAPDGVEAFVKGVGGKQCAWLDETVKLMNSRITMGNTMTDLLKSIVKAEEGTGA